MARYLVDGVPLSADEEARHKGACNAALSVLCDVASGDSERLDVAERALAQADALVRAHRRRVEAACVATAPPPGDPVAYRLADDGAIVARWAQGDLELTIGRNLAIGKLRALAYPLTLREIDERGELRRGMARELVDAGVLVPVPEGEDAR